MKKINLILLIVLLLFSSTVFAATSWVDPSYNSTNTGGHTWQVDAFSNITSAVSATSAGSTIYVAYGTYNEAIRINKTLTLSGNMSRINSPVYEAFYVSGNNVIITGFNLTNLPNGAVTSAGDNLAVNNNIIQNSTLNNGYYLTKFTESVINPIYGGPTSGVNRAYHPFVIHVGSTYHLWYGDGANLRYTNATNRNLSDATFPGTIVSGLNSSQPYKFSVYYNAAGWDLNGNHYTQPFINYYTEAVGSWSTQPKIAVSDNGLNWTHITSVTGVYGYTSSAVYRMSVIQEGPNQWKGWADSGQAIIQAFNSTNGVNWTGLKTDILYRSNATYLQSWWETSGIGQISPNVVKINGMYIMFYSSGSAANDNAIGAALSRDGVNFIKYPGNPLFSKFDGVVWRNDRTYNPYVMQDTDGNWYMYIMGRSSVSTNYSVGIAQMNIAGLMNASQNFWGNDNGPTYSNLLGSMSYCPWATDLTFSDFTCIARSVTDCTNITNPGSYKLINNIDKSAGYSGQCISILSDDTTLNLDGYNITGDSFSDAFADLGIAVIGKNIIINGNGSTISNWGLSGPGVGIGMGIIGNNSIINNIRWYNNTGGVVVFNGNNFTIQNSIMEYTGLGIFSGGTFIQGATLRNISFYNSADSAIAFIYGANNLLIDGINLIYGTNTMFTFATSLTNSIIQNINAEHINKIVDINGADTVTINNFTATDYTSAALFQNSMNLFFSNVYIHNGSDSAIDLETSSNNIFNNIQLYDTPVYSISSIDWGLSLGNTLVFNNTFGEMKYKPITSNINQNIDGLNIQITYNSAFTNLSIPANITLYGLSSFINPQIFKDGVICGASCYNFTSLNAGTVKFNVTGTGNYSIVSVPISANPTISSSAGWSITEGTSTTINCTADGNVVTTLYKEGVYTGTNFEIWIPTTGTFNYVCNYTANANYSYAESYGMLTVIASSPTPQSGGYPPGVSYILEAARANLTANLTNSTIAVNPTSSPAFEFTETTSMVVLGGSFAGLLWFLVKG